MKPSSRDNHCRRGSIGLSIVLVLLLIQLVIVASVLAGGRDQDTSVKRLDSLRAFYAAESGMNMALREWNENSDYDNDGTIGSVSNDGNSANDPVIGGGQVHVTFATGGGVNTMTSYGSAGSATRRIQTTASTAPDSSNNVSNQQTASQGTLGYNGTLTSMTAHVKGQTSKYLRCALYSDSSNSPNALLAQSANDLLRSNAALYWHTVSMPVTAVTSGTFWLALGVEHTNVYYSYKSTGVLKTSTNDPITSGYTNPWGGVASTLTRTINMFATIMQTTTGPYNFSSWTQLSNATPQVLGVFRDVTSVAYIRRGNDVSTNAVHYTAMNFTAGAGVTVSNAYTVYDTVPSTTTQTDFTGSIRVQGDVITTGAGTKYIGFAALHNESVGQDGIVVVMRKAASDRLEVFRLPQNGDITGASSLATSSNLSLSDNTWYRLVMDLTVYDGSVYVVANLYGHSTSTDPNSSVNVTPIGTLAYSNTVSALTGLQTTGEVAVAFDTTNNTARGCMTNFSIYSNPVAFPSVSATGSVTAWSEIP